MINAKDVSILLDQDDLVTVVGKVGDAVIIVNGEGRGESATLEEIREDDFCAKLKTDKGQIIDNVEYEYFSKKQ